MRARSIGTPPALKVQSVPCESDGVRIIPKPCWTLYEPSGTAADPTRRPSSAWMRKHAVVAARDERAVVDEGDVLRRRVRRDRADEPARARVVDRDPAPVAGGDPDAGGRRA